MREFDFSPKEVAHAMGGEVSGKEVLAPGPGHSPKDRSLSIRINPDAPDGFVVHSFAGDDAIACKDYVRDALGLRWEPESRSQADDPVSRMVRRVTQPSAAAEYTYALADGAPYLRVKRSALKKFYQQHWTGTGWSDGAPEGPKIPYRLPQLMEAEHTTALIVEGEKDADRLASLGLMATTNAGGAGNWSADLNEHFKDRDVYILPDNDEPGERHARKVVESLTGIAREIRIVRLPDLPPKGDVSDWLDAGGTLEDLVALMESTPALTGMAEPVAKPSPLRWLDMSAWDEQPTPERQWAIRDRVPLKQAGLFSGEGGTGKSIIELQKNVAHVLNRDWLGSLPEAGPAFYLGAEDDADEIHIRLAGIAKHYGVTFKELTDGGLHVLPLLGQDATLCAAGRGGKVEVTNLYRWLYEAAGDIKPKNISVDTLSRAFAGNEIDRVQVYAFAMHMQALAKVANGAVTILSHPSLQGINSGSGLSGSTAWHGAFRFRQYLKGVKATEGDEPDNDLREIEFKKNQYGPRGASMVLRYNHGLFLPEGGASSLDTLAREAKADDLFLTLLRKFAEQGRHVSATSTAPNFAPTAFAGDPEATRLNLRKGDLKAAMARLFDTGKVFVEQYGRPSRPASRLAVKQ